jgi:hypothetical protein
VHPESRAEADETLSLTVIWHVDDEYGDDWILNAPLESLVPVTEPGETVTAEFATAPFPSTRSWPLFSSARLIVIAAPALAATIPTASIATTKTASRTSRCDPRRWK